MSFISLIHLQTALNKIKTIFDTKAELTDIPDKLPADGGNADTVDGKHAVDFLPNKAECVNGANYDDFAVSGFYEVLGNADNPTQNSPTGNETNNNFYLIVQRRSNEYCSQIAVSVKTDKSVYIRNKSNNIWDSWTKIMAGNADTVNGHTVNANVPADAVFTDTTYNTVSQTEDGLMSAADKKKLDGVAEGANKYVHPTTEGNKHIPSGGTDNQILAYSADGTAKWSSYSYVRSFVPILGHISEYNPTAEIMYQTGRNRCILLLFANYLLVNDTNPKFISASRFIDFTNGAETTLDKTDIVNIDGCENPVYMTIGKNSDGKCRILLEGTSNVTHLALWYNI